MSSNYSVAACPGTARDLRRKQLLAAQVRLLYRNAGTGIGVTILAAPLLGYLQWNVINHSVVVSWVAYMLLISLARFVLTRLRKQLKDFSAHVTGWDIQFVTGAGLAGAGWGTAGILLYPPDNLANQVLLVFVLGGMMLGGASLLAPRPEAFFAFLVPTGCLPVLRLLAEPDQQHRIMGLLAFVFTIATVSTTWRFYCAIKSSFNLQFENQELVESLRIANNRAEALNAELEERVQQRTAELHNANECLRQEMKQREQMEQDLLRVRNLESLGVLAGGIAHDFNNLLTVVQGYVELTRMKLGVNSTAREYLDLTINACERAAFLASQLLTFAKGGAPVRRVVSLAALILDAVHLSRAGSSISMDVQIASDLAYAEVDSGQMGHVFHNILLNAKQAMPAGGIVEVRAANVLLGDDRQPHVRITIKDYGCGIPAAVLPRIFDPYFTTKPAGTGLGLTTAYAIVTKHGGRLSVESEEGRGTTFTVDLLACLKTPELLPVAQPITAGTGKLLVMDDEESLRRLLQQLLTSLGYEVHTARDGAEAIALYEAAQESANPFDAVLLDLTVGGGMGGVEAADRLKQIHPSSNLIVTSGYSDAPIMSEYAKYGFDDVVRKPWTTVELSGTVERVLSKRRERKPN